MVVGGVCCPIPSCGKFYPLLSLYVDHYFTHAEWRREKYEADLPRYE